MPVATMQEGRDFAPDEDAPMSAAQAVSQFLSPVMALGPAGHLGPREEIELELDLIAAAIRTFYAKTPDQVMRECSAYTGRLTELAVLLHRVEATNRSYTRIRTQQVERFLVELDRQFKTHSRLVEVSRQELATVRGQI